jgi:hypothetical protein
MNKGSNYFGSLYVLRIAGRIKCFFGLIGRRFTFAAAKEKEEKRIYN